MSTLELWRTDRGPLTFFNKDWDSFFQDFDRSFQKVKPACDVEEDATSYQLNFDLPGYKKEDVNIELLGNRITVTGKRSRGKNTQEAKFHLAERNYGEFKRVFTLPDNAEGDKLEASFENGVLNLTIPKSEIEKPRRVEIRGA